MRQFKGTKGEWYAEIHPAEHCSVLSEINQGGTIAEVSDGTYWGCDNGFEVSKANAQLIAAAPEMLEALIALMDGISNLPPLASIAGTLEKQYKQAEKVINKALTL